MVKNGAKHIIFLSRSGSANPKPQPLVSNLERAGVNVAVFKCDVGDIAQLATVLEESQCSMPPSEASYMVRWFLTYVKNRLILFCELLAKVYYRIPSLTLCHLKTFRRRCGLR